MHTGMVDAQSKIVVCYCSCVPPPFVARRPCVTGLNDEIHLPPPPFTLSHVTTSPHTDPMAV